MTEDQNKIENSLRMIGKRIRSYRRAAKITQEELAGAIDCSVSYISHLERGKAHISVLRLIEIAECLKVDAGEILRGTTPNTNDFLEPEFKSGISKMSDEEKMLLRELMQAVLNAAERRK